MEITSLQNAKVKYWVSLKNKKIRDKDQVFLVEGDHLINEALKKNLVVETISTVSKDRNYFVTKEIMQKISNQKSICKEAAVCKFLKSEDIKGNVLILDGLQDPGNLGTIIRSAVAFNFDTVILSIDSVDLYNDKVIRASEGMIFHLNVLRGDLKDYILKLKAKGYEIIGTKVTYTKKIKYSKKNIALVIGNEGKGIKKNILNLCDKYKYIPMEKTCESLNAGVAASILMYEVYNAQIL